MNNALIQTTLIQSINLNQFNFIKGFKPLQIRSEFNKIAKNYNSEWKYKFIDSSNRTNKVNNWGYISYVLQWITRYVNKHLCYLSILYVLWSCYKLLSYVFHKIKKCYIFENVPVPIVTFLEIIKSNLVSALSVVTWCDICRSSIVHLLNDVVLII